MVWETPHVHVFGIVFSPRKSCITAPVLVVEAATSKMPQGAEVETWVARKPRAI